MSKIKQVIILRKDLKMRLGKAAAQAAHASMKVFFDRFELAAWRDRQTGKLASLLCEKIDFTAQMVEWMKGSFTKVVVSCNSEEELFKLKSDADTADIVNALIQDNGETEFKEICPDCSGEGLCVANGDVVLDTLVCLRCRGTGKLNKPTYTALAIGPDYSEKIDLITKHLKCL